MEVTVVSPAMPLWVVAAAIVDRNGRVLVQQRPPDTSMAGLWEFPGGKVEPGETPEAALMRELHEELGIAVSLADIPGGLFVTTHVGDRPLILLLYLCRSWHGEAQPLHATALKWCHLSELAALPMPPADVPLVEMLAELMRPATNPSS
jgi:8-oxo-dGTP diphosphatase